MEARRKTLEEKALAGWAVVMVCEACCHGLGGFVVRNSINIDILLFLGPVISLKHSPAAVEKRWRRKKRKAANNKVSGACGARTGPNQCCGGRGGGGLHRNCLPPFPPPPRQFWILFVWFVCFTEHVILQLQTPAYDSLVEPADQILSRNISQPAFTCGSEVWNKFDKVGMTI